MLRTNYLYTYVYIYVCVCACVLRIVYDAYSCMLSVAEEACFADSETAVTTPLRGLVAIGTE